MGQSVHEPSFMYQNKMAEGREEEEHASPEGADVEEPHPVYESYPDPEGAFAEPREQVHSQPKPLFLGPPTFKSSRHPSLRNRLDDSSRPDRLLLWGGGQRAVSFKPTAGQSGRVVGFKRLSPHSLADMQLIRGNVPPSRRSGPLP